MQEYLIGTWVVFFQYERIITSHLSIWLFYYYGRILYFKVLTPFLKFAHQLYLSHLFIPLQKNRTATVFEGDIDKNNKCYKKTIVNLSPINIYKKSENKKASTGF